MYLYKLAYMKFWENSVDTRADAVEGCLTLWERLDDPMDSTGCIVECNDDAEPIGKVEWIDCSEYFDDTPVRSDRDEHFWQGNYV